MTRILVVEDQHALARMLAHNLELEGYEVEIVGGGAAALAACERVRFDLVILDLMIPIPDGLTVLKTLRARGDEPPVIVLTAKGEASDKLRGLRGGADDYVTKPFDLMELLARVAAVLRRAQSPTRGAGERSILTVADLHVDLTTRTVTKGGTAIHLKPKEYELLVALLRRRGKVAKRAELLDEVWGYHPSVVSRTLDTHILELRKKLEDDAVNPTLIITVRKSGFRVAAGSS